MNALGFCLLVALGWWLIWGEVAMQTITPIAYAIKLAAMTADELGAECKRKIWLSAYADNNPRSCYHWQVDVCANECDLRQRMDIYQDAYEANLAAAQ